MKIGSPVDHLPAADITLRPGRAAPGSSVRPAGPAGDQVAVSAAGIQLGSFAAGDFDAAKVESIRQAIREGRFTINPDAIADRLIADVAALLGPRGA